MTFNGVQKSQNSAANIFIQSILLASSKFLQLKALNADVGLWTSHAADYTSPVKWPFSAIFWHKNPIQPFSIFFSLKHTVLSWRAMGAMELNPGFSWSSLDLQPICPRCALFVSQCTNVLEQAVTVHWPSSPIKSHLLSSGWKGYVDRGGKPDECIIELNCLFLHFLFPAFKAGFKDAAHLKERKGMTDRKGGTKIKLFPEWLICLVSRRLQLVLLKLLIYQLSMFAL